MLEFADFNSKVAVVTGAAGAIGQSVVKLLASNGASVVATDLHEAQLRETYEHLLGSVDIRCLDVTNAEDSRRLAADIQAQYGRLDVWINNAGILERQAALEISADDWRRHIEINLNGTFFGSQAAASVMAKNGGGSIVNLSSFAGTRARPGVPHYATAKAAVAHLTQCLALEWGKVKIRVNAIAPGYIQTPMTSWLHSDPAYAAPFLEKTPLGRLGQPDEIAEHILYLASDVSSFMTGNILVVDGGVRLS
ncbi:MULTISPECIES: SDR family NAD(P)-dependent oxidoreductase [Caballeronia]|uniref:SDR family NAD(P)-dependent oxidoreductase n=1 Tax=Caballeronia TaxID=1827195 RepID=UPI001FD2F64D|nr:MULTISPECIES: SDR family oxidoreductase [Caballeronia]MDR5799142.1 SDR family NAD(P)-dependent oxidoreductase [Caballeronia sp. LZ001]